MKFNIFIIVVFASNCGLAMSRNPRLLGGTLVTQEELESGKYSSWSVGSVYKIGVGGCAGVLISSTRFVALKECLTQSAIVSTGSVSALVATPGSGEYYDTTIAVVSGQLVAVEITQRPGFPEKPIGVPIIRAKIVTPPRPGQNCQMFGFGSPTRNEHLLLNRLQITIVGITDCQAKWSSLGLTIDPSLHFCAYVKTKDGTGAVCDDDKNGPVFCQQRKTNAWKTFFFSKDDEEEEEEENPWVFAGFVVNVNDNYNYCDSAQSLPTVFYYVSF